MNIDEMKAGAALDQLACEALGIAPSYEWWVVDKTSDSLVIKGSEVFSARSDTDEQRCEVWCRQHDTDIYERRVFARWFPISTQPAAMVAAISRVAWCIMTPPSSSPHVRKYWYVELERNVGDGERYANGETAMEAFARAAAKTKGGVMDTKNDCQQCRFCFCECGEDIVCGHPESFKETIFGRGVNYARRPGSFCGPEGKLFEQRKTQ